MTRTIGSCAAIAALMAAEAAAAIVLLLAAAPPASAQFFDDRFPSQYRRQQQQQQQRGTFDWFFPQQQWQQQQPQWQQPPRQREEQQQRRERVVREPREAVREPREEVDYSKAPAAKKPESKAEGAVTTPIMVLGDSMADWLAYGLELAYVESPDVGILRRHRTNSGLIRAEGRNDPRGEYPDWPQTARELIAAQKPKFVLMMIGINDRRSLRESAPAQAQGARSIKPPSRVDDGAELELDAAESAKVPVEKGADQPPAAAAEPSPSGGSRTLEFRTDAWSEAYIRRIDDTIAALKTSNVPVLWVGLPPLRGQKSSADMSFLNDLYRSRADKAGIVYVDVWDGFVDEDGRFNQSGPDVEGQTRRLRTPDGVYFTQAGARKLAHFVDREIARWTTARANPAVLPEPDEPKAEAAVKPGHPGTPETAAAAPGAAHARPLAGPTVPLLADRANEAQELLGGNSKSAAPDAIVAKVLTKGEALRAPAGRADDFAWPGRSVAAQGSDPAVTTAELPMTPMLAEKPAAANTATGSTTNPAPTKDAASAAAKPRRVAQRPAPANTEAQPVYRPAVPRRETPPPQTGFFGFPLFGGRW